MGAPRRRLALRESRRHMAQGRSLRGRRRALRLQRRRLRSGRLVPRARRHLVCINRERRAHRLVPGRLVVPPIRLRSHGHRLAGLRRHPVLPEPGRGRRDGNRLDQGRRHLVPPRCLRRDEHVHVGMGGGLVLPRRIRGHSHRMVQGRRRPGTTRTPAVPCTPAGSATAAPGTTWAALGPWPPAGCSKARSGTT